MTKKEILRSIDSLIRDLDEWTTKRVKASLDKDNKAYQEAMFNLEGLAADSQQELTYLRDFINSLPEESVSKDLEKAASNHAKEYFDMLNIDMKDNLLEASKIILDFKAGAKWQKEQDIKPESESLEASANKYAHEYTRTDAFIEKACDAYCAICDTKECDGCAECTWVIKFRRQLL